MSGAGGRGGRALATVARLRRLAWLRSGREAAVRMLERRESEQEAEASAVRAAGLRADVRSLARARAPDGGTSRAGALAASASGRRGAQEVAMREEGRAGRLRTLAAGAGERAIAAAAIAASERERLAAVGRAVARREAEEARRRESELEREAEETREAEEVRDARTGR